MDWLILLLLIPAVLVPVVLQCGFCGCSLLIPASRCESDGDCSSGFRCDDGACIEGNVILPVPSAPDGLAANAVSDGAINVSWTDTDPTATDHFEVDRHEEGEVFARLRDPVTGAVLKVTGEAHVDLDVTEGTTYFYQVRACNSDDECSQPSEGQPIATTFPTAPSGLVATPVSVDQINLRWSNNSARATQFRLEERSSVASPFTEIFRGPGTSFSHTLLAEGTAHEYRVFAVVRNGFQNSTGPQDILSAPSSAASATTLAFTPTFSSGFAINTDQPGVEAFCIVQRIPSALLSTSGTREVKIALRGSTAGPLTLDQIFISQVAAGGDPYDAAADLTPVASAVVLQANTVLTLPPITYSLDRTQDLLIAFDVSAIPGQGNLRFGTLAGAESFARGATAEAAVADRTSGFTPAPNNLYLIESILVL